MIDVDSFVFGALSILGFGAVCGIIWGVYSLMISKFACRNCSCQKCTKRIYGSDYTPYS